MPVFDFFAWFVLLWLLAPLAWPLSCRLWRYGGVLNLPDGGWAAGRMLALTSWTLLVFWAGHAGIAVRFSLWLLLPLLLLSGVAWWKNRRECWQNAREKWRSIALADGVFLLVFLLGLLLRSYWPDTGNGEKPMDIALVGACARADLLPPPNPYLSGARLGGYYYLGHLQTAVLTDAIGSQARWTYNMMCATLPALCFSLLFPLAAALTGALQRGAMVCLLVLTTGTLEPIRQWIEEHPEGGVAWPFGPRALDYFSTSRVIPNPINREAATGLPAPDPNTGRPLYNYTINEFPLFTFTYGDLHAHFFAMPVSLLVLCLGLGVWNRVQVLAGRDVATEIAKTPAQVLADGTQPSSRQKRRAGLVARGLICGLVLSALLVTNTWDIPAYWLFLALCWWPMGMSWSPFKRRQSAPLVEVALSNTARKKLARQNAAQNNGVENPVPVRTNVQNVFAGTRAMSWQRWAVLVAAMSAALVLGALPYLGRLHTNATKPTPLDLPATPILAWLLMWGVIMTAWGLAVWRGFAQENPDRSFETHALRALWLLLPLTTWLLLNWGPSWSWTWTWPMRDGNGFEIPYAVTYRNGDYASILVLLTLLVTSLRLAFVTSSPRVGILCRMAICGLVALLWSELTWAGFLGRSETGMTFHRQDTVFKFGLQGWYLIGIAAACAVLGCDTARETSDAEAVAPQNDAESVAASTCSTLWSEWAWPGRGAFAVLLAVMWVAGWSCVKARARNFEHLEVPDAWAHLAIPEREAAAWMQSRARDGDVLLEAEQKEGGDYSAFTRYGHATGIPVVIGPSAHTFQWGDGKRNAGEMWEIVGKRKDDVRNFYTRSDASTRGNLLQKYGVRFIVAGELEAQEYGAPAVDSLIAAYAKARVFGDAGDPHRVVVIDLQQK